MIGRSFARSGGARRGGARRVALGVVFATLALAGVASAHLGHVILRAERYLKLDASETDTRLVVSLTLGPSEGERILAAADANGDHTVSSAEADAYLAQWGDGLRTDVPIEIDGAPFEATWTEGYLDPIGTVGPTPLTVEITAHLPVRGREHQIRFRDHMRREVFDRTDVAFRAHDGAELVASGPGESPSEPTPDLGLVRGDAGTDVFTARVRYPGRSDLDLRGVGAAVGALVLVVAAVVVARRRR